MDGSRGVFRFLHAADLHLDSPFRGLRQLVPAAGRTLSRATFEAYERIISLAIDQNVDAVVIAGDVYDGADRSLRAQLAFVEGLQRLAEEGIRAFVAHGNHDPLDGWEAGLRLPDGCHRFGPEPEAVPFDPQRPDRVVIQGMSYPTRSVRDNVARRFRADRRAALNIAVLHATVGTQPGHDPYAPCNMADLAAAGFDYWALGHVHERQVLRERDPAVVYPGNPQGRHLKEQGARGVYLVELAPGGKPVLAFEPCDVARWARLEVAIEELVDEQDLLDALLHRVAQATAGAEGRLLVAVPVLSGDGPLREAVNRDSVLEELLEHLNRRLDGDGRRAIVAAIENRTVARRESATGQSPDFLHSVREIAATVHGNDALLEVLRAEIDELLAQPRVRNHLRADAEELVRDAIAAGAGRAVDLVEELTS